MKYSLIVIFYILGFNCLSAQSFTDSEGETHLWGPINVTQLQQAPFQEWFEESTEDFKTNLNPKQAPLFKDVKVKVFVGTWCGDTQYLVPKFIHAWEQLGLPVGNLDIIGLHYEKELYKQGPNKETVGLNIHKVPTFIFEKNGEEIGRIVERTVFDLDTDMLQIVKGNPYRERYQGVKLLNKHFQNTHVDSLHTKTSLNSAYRKIRREVSTSSELNAYGYTLKYQDLISEAEFVFKLNKFLFPYNPNVRDSYGEVLMDLGKYDLAKEQFYEVIRLKKEDSNAINKLSEINQLPAKIKSD